MKIYVDLILLLNFILDFIILLSVKIILKRNTTLFRLILSSFIGSLTILILFIKITSLELFIIKIVLSIIMNIIAFNYKNIKYLFKNILFFYISSIILGGFLYFLNIEFSYKNNGLIFIKNNLSINFIFLIIISPIIIYIYIKQVKQLKNNYNKYYEITIYFKDNKIKKYIGYLDTGNKLKDPYKNRPIIIINYFKNNYPKILVPCNTVNKKDLLECFSVDKIYINNKYVKNVLIGLSKNKINIDGVDCILNSLLEDKI